MELHGVLFREGDKVMQMKNNYQIKWEIRGYNHMMIEEGSGVFNGDCGIITEIDTFNKEVTVRFDDEKYVTYPQGNLDELNWRMPLPYISRREASIRQLCCLFYRDHGR